MSAPVHVWKVDAATLCGAPATRAIWPEELRRRIHTHGRAKVEPTICPKCYAAARPTRGAHRPPDYFQDGQPKDR